VDALKSSGKSFEISKWEVQEAYEKVKANKGAPGVDGRSIEVFEKDLKNNLYRIWNRMSSGSYFPPPVKAVEIPKSHGDGVRSLGVPTVADRIAQTVVARRLEEKIEPIFHQDSYGYRPRRSALDAVAACRQRCWKYAWVIDLDIQRFFDSVPWDLTVKAVEAHTDLPWVVLYVQRWLEAPMQLPDGTLQQRDRGTPQGALCAAEHNDPCGVPLSRSRLVPSGSCSGAFSQRVTYSNTHLSSVFASTALITRS
jgi:group II intron reverse transcriptase/maturase